MTKRIHQPMTNDVAALWLFVRTAKHEDGRQAKSFEMHHAASLLVELDPAGVEAYRKKG